MTTTRGPQRRTQRREWIRAERRIRRPAPIPPDAPTVNPSIARTWFGPDSQEG